MFLFRNMQTTVQLLVFLLVTSASYGIEVKSVYRGPSSCELCRTILDNNEESPASMSDRFIAKRCATYISLHDREACTQFALSYNVILNVLLSNRNLEDPCSTVQLCGSRYPPTDQNQIFKKLCERCQRTLIRTLIRCARSVSPEQASRMLHTLCSKIAIFGDTEQCVRDTIKRVARVGYQAYERRITPYGICRMYGWCRFTRKETTVFPWPAFSPWPKLSTWPTLPEISLPPLPVGLPNLTLPDIPPLEEIPEIVKELNLTVPEEWKRIVNTTNVTVPETWRETAEEYNITIPSVIPLPHIPGWTTPWSTPESSPNSAQKTHQRVQK